MQHFFVIALCVGLICIATPDSARANRVKIKKMHSKTASTNDMLNDSVPASDDPVTAKPTKPTPTTALTNNEKPNSEQSPDINDGVSPNDKEKKDESNSGNVVEPNSIPAPPEDQLVQKNETVPIATEKTEVDVSEDQTIGNKQHESNQNNNATSGDDEDKIGGITEMIEKLNIKDAVKPDNSVDKSKSDDKNSDGSDDSEEENDLNVEDDKTKPKNPIKNIEPNQKHINETVEPSNKKHEKEANIFGKHVKVTWSDDVMKGEIDSMELLVELSEKVEIVLEILVNFLNKGGKTPLHYAVTRGNTKLAEYFVTRRGANVNSRGAYGKTPLQLAFAAGNLQIVDTLLKNGANGNVTDDLNGRTFLHFALQNDKSGQLAHVMLDNHAKISADNDGVTPLHLAIEEEIYDVAERIIRSRITDVNFKTNSGKNALHLAAAKGALNIVRALLANGADVDATDGSGLTALHYAAQNGAADLADMLLTVGADPNQGDDTADRPLHYSARYGRVNVSDLLIQNNADYEAKNIFGETPLQLAIKYDHFHEFEDAIERNSLRIVHDKVEDNTEFLIKAVIADNIDEIRRLVKKFCNVNGIVPEQNRNEVVSGDTVLIWAAAHGRVNAVNELIKAKANVNASNVWGFTSLHKAVISGNTSTVEALINASADVNAINNNGETPFYLAVLLGKTNIVELFINRGKYVDTPAKNGDSPLIAAIKIGSNETFDLIYPKSNINYVNEQDHKQSAIHYAAAEGNMYMIEKLIDQGEDVSRVCSFEDTPTPALIAAKQNHPEIVEYLAKKGANIAFSNSHNETVLHFAAMHNNATLVEFLLEKGVKVDVCSLKGETPLIIAASKGLLENGKVLIRHGANVNHQDSDAMTPLHYVAISGSVELTQALLDAGAKTNIIDRFGYSALNRALRAGRRAIGFLLLKK